MMMLSAVPSTLGKGTRLTTIPEYEHVSFQTADSSQIWSELMQKAVRRAVREGIHQKVNDERAARHLHPLKRSRFLDSLASLHANHMAQNCAVMQSVKNVAELRAVLHSKAVGENVQYGVAVNEMHKCTMRASESISRRNILSSRFTEMGSAVARGVDGKLYLCQLFRQA